MSLVTPSYFLNREGHILDWKQHSVNVVRARELDTNPPQSSRNDTCCSNNERAFRKLRAGTVVAQPCAKTALHHHGELETVSFATQG